MMINWWQMSAAGVVVFILYRVAWRRGRKHTIERLEQVFPGAQRREGVLEIVPGTGGQKQWRYEFRGGGWSIWEDDRESIIKLAQDDQFSTGRVQERIKPPVTIEVLS